MADRAVPVTIGEPSKGKTVPDLAWMLGDTATDVLRLHMSVIDREDRLESGTGEWKSAFIADGDARAMAAREAVLRALRTAFDPVNFKILGLLNPNLGTPIEQLSRECGIGRLSLAERIGDLVSAGLVSKIPEANQVAGSALGAFLVDLVTRAGEAGGRQLGQGRK